MRTKKRLFFCLLGGLAITFLFTQYFHTETTIEPDDDCSICVWERNVVAVSQLYFLFLLVLFTCLFKFFVFHCRLKTVIRLFHFNSRAPPAV